MMTVHVTQQELANTESSLFEIYENLFTLTTTLGPLIKIPMKYNKFHNHK